MSTIAAKHVAAATAKGARWRATRLRVKSLKSSTNFYQTNFGMKLLGKESERVATLATIPAAHKSIPVADLFAMRYDPPAWLVLLELEEPEKAAKLPLVVDDAAARKQAFASGNGDALVGGQGEKTPRGFGHIAFNVDDVYAVSEELEKAGVPFKKRPDEGRMKGLAFCLGPDGEWIELVAREKGIWRDPSEKYNLSQTMLRVEDAQASKRFFIEGLGMAQASEKHFEMAAFSLFFLATPADAAAAEGAEHALDTKKQWAPALELTHNHGTELPGNVGEKYTSGSDNTFLGKEYPLSVFSRLSFTVDDLQATLAALSPLLQSCAVIINKRTLIRSPTGYYVELVERQ